jgi:DNA-binding response OmpR family regulator
MHMAADTKEATGEDDEVRLVVVDDSRDAAEVLACALALDGYRVRIAHDGGEAIALVEGYKPHGVLLDIDMPGIDGNELSRLLRERFGDDIVLIAVTGRGGHEKRVSATFARVDHYLTKPVSAVQLRKVLPPLHG